ncbi:hypothetical protein Btru_023664 [Bulinus truncatus]|nr:hypothetical protein Btru_023664 [Bulinus truncatus]
MNNFVSEPSTRFPSLYAGALLRPTIRIYTHGAPYAWKIPAPCRPCDRRSVWLACTCRQARTTEKSAIVCPLCCVLRDTFHTYKGKSKPHPLPQ